MDPGWSGRPLEVSEGFARVSLTTVEAMAVDDSGLVHGGFTFSAADHAAMLAVNHPLVVLGSASVRFPAPVPEGSRIRGAGEIISAEAVKGGVQVVVRVTIEIEGSDRPACVIDTISRFFP